MKFLRNLTPLSKRTSAAKILIRKDDWQLEVLFQFPTTVLVAKWLLPRRETVFSLDQLCALIWRVIDSGVCLSIVAKGEFQFSLVAGVNLNVSNTMLFVGGVSYGNMLNIRTGITLTSDCNVQYGHSIDFDDWSNKLTGLSSRLAMIAGSGTTVQFNYGTKCGWVK